MTNSEPVLYYRMDAPAYTAPASDTWPVLTNYGTVPVNGVYTAGHNPGRRGRTNGWRRCFQCPA